MFWRMPLAVSGKSVCTSNKELVAAHGAELLAIAKANNMSRLRRYYKDCDYQLCEYSALVKLMWRGHLHPQYAEAAGCLIVKNCIDGKPCFDYPVPGPDGDEEAALCAIEDYCVEQGISLELSVVPKEKAAKLLERYPRFHLNNFRSCLLIDTLLYVY